MMSAASTSPASKSLITKFLTTPQRVAGALDWKKVAGSVLNVSITKGVMNLAVASHPSFQEPAQSLPIVPLNFHVEENRMVLDDAVVREFANIVAQYNVCGVVVHWPVQREGWCGAQCGRVLHVLDQLSRNTDIMSGGRPVCLWDSRHHECHEDGWGRDPTYGIPTDKSLHVASKDQYDDGPTSCVASEIWNDFVSRHWTEMMHDHREQQQQHQRDRYPDKERQIIGDDAMIFSEFTSEAATARHESSSWLDYATADDGGDLNVGRSSPSSASASRRSVGLAASMMRQRNGNRKRPTSRRLQYCDDMVLPGDTS